jgi:hypothetical protein
MGPRLRRVFFLWARRMVSSVERGHLIAVPVSWPQEFL